MRRASGRRGDGHRREITGLVGVYTNPRHVILYRSEAMSARQT
jgi:hypothetical protein